MKYRFNFEVLFSAKIRKLFFFFLILFSCIIPFANAVEESEDSLMIDWNTLSRNLVIDINTTAPMQVSGYDNIDYIELTQRAYPKNLDDSNTIYKQSVLSFSAYPEEFLVYSDNDYIRYRLEADDIYSMGKTTDKLDIRFSTYSRVKTNNNMDLVKKEHIFPYEIEAELLPFIASTDLIDSDDPEISAKAREIIGDEDDLYRASVMLASWVHDNIDYVPEGDISSSSKEASWVLENRKGVCDEFSHLFMAMLRSLGVPCRFVSGISYSTSDIVEYEWGFHGWVEVYFPGEGWFPFDPTYGEYGLVDPTHIVFNTYAKNKQSTSFRWKGDGSDIVLSSTQPDVKLQSASGSIEEPVEIILKAYSGEVGLDSCNMISAIISNKAEGYYTPVLQISNVNGFDIFPLGPVPVILGPREDKKVYWKVCPIDALAKGRIYTIPVSVKTLFGSVFNYSYVMSDSGSNLLEDDFPSVDILNKEESENSMTEIACFASSDIVNMDDKVEIRCEISISPNISDNDISVCLSQDCKRLSDISENPTTVFFDMIAEKPGSNIVQVILEADDIRRTSITSFTVEDKPNLEISNLNVSDTVSYENNFTVFFQLKKKSYSVPKNITVTVNSNYFTYTYSLEKLSSDRNITLEIPGRHLSYGDNIVEVIAEVDGSDGNEILSRSSALVKLKDLTFTNKLEILGRNAGYWLKQLLYGK